MNTTKEDMALWMGFFPNQTFADDVCHIIGSLGNVGIVDTDEGLVVFDIGTRQMGPRIFKEFREFSDKPIKYIIYSHGHFDHAFGFAPFIEEIKEKGWEMPEVIAHENLPKRFEKYRMLHGYHNWLNSMQFASQSARSLNDIASAKDTLDPTIVLHGNESYTFKLGKYTFELYHNISK